MKLFKTYLGLVLLQLIFATALILLLTGLRYFDNHSFSRIMGEYNKYADFDADTSLVYGDDA
ncbi:MAG: hypothetical protein UIG59_05630 [Acutalibacteraceae bacterium]|nr:hypothetical protein [Acutalibacteraceae bacterium]